MIPLFFSFGGSFLALYQYTRGFSTLFARKQFKAGRALYTFLNRKWFFDKVYNEWIASPLLRVAYVHTYQNRDRGLLEYFGPQGLATELFRRSRDLTSLPLGFVFRRLFVLLSSLAFLLAFSGG